MSRFRRFDIIEHSSPSYNILNQTSFIFAPPRMLNPHFPFLEPRELDLLAPPPLLLDDFETITDLIQIDETPFRTSTRRVTRRAGPGDLYLQALSDRVSALELGFDRLVKKKKDLGQRKYTWTAEIKNPENERKYKWEVKDGLKKSYEWTAEIKRKGEGPVEQTYKVTVSSGGEPEEEKKKKKKAVKCEKVKKVGSSARVVEIEDATDRGGIFLRQVFAKRVEKKRGKRKELSQHEAAALIQKIFRAYVIRRSQALRALRELAIAKTKLKDIRALFNNFSYRRHLSRDAEERQRFSEKIIVLLLTVDAIEGADMMVRSAKKSMVDELEAMLDVVDPQPSRRSLSMKRRTFDMPDGTINRELAAGVAQVVRMLDQEATNSETFEACL